MSFDTISYTGSKAERYDTLLSQTKALMEGITHPIANLANIAALLWQGLEGINWCGFYLMDDGALMLAPFCGLPACIRIPLGRGVCGTAAEKDEIQRVYDVHQFPGHIACDSASNSEIVVPIFRQGKVCGVLDIDSPEFSRFSQEDRRCLEAVVKILEKTTFFS